MTLNEALSIRIDELLAERGITQYRLAINSGLPSQAISKIRLQKNKMCAVNIIYEEDSDIIALLFYGVQHPQEEVMKKSRIITAVLAFSMALATMFVFAACGTPLSKARAESRPRDIMR